MSGKAPTMKSIRLYSSRPWRCFDQAQSTPSNAHRSLGTSELPSKVAIILEELDLPYEIKKLSNADTKKKWFAMEDPHTKSTGRTPPAAFEEAC